MNEEPFAIENAKALQATQKALLISATNLDADIWVPHSQIDDASEVYRKGDKGTLIVSGWFARQRGWL